MKARLILIFLILLGSCRKSDSVVISFKTNGIPDGNQGFDYFYFIDKNEGYLFGTLSYRANETQNKTKRTKTPSHSRYEANIFKTINGGMTWVKIDSIDNCSYYKKGLFHNGSIYMQLIDEDKNHSHLLKFNPEDGSKVILDYNFERMGFISDYKNQVCVVNKRNGVSKLYYINDDFGISDSVICNIPLKSRIISTSKKSVALTWNDEIYNLSDNKLLKYNSGSLKEIVKLNDYNFLIFACEEDKTRILSYNTQTNIIKTSYEIKGYATVKEAQSNNNVIVVFIANSYDVVMNYDLLYSIDKGRTWQVQKLIEGVYARPSCLIDTTMYIYSGASIMQRFIFK